jgi:hypothetical protein
VNTAWLTADARADGDPASDVLAFQALFLPGDGGIPTNRQAEIAELLEAASRAGYPLRVAVIATPADMGSVSALWRHPGSYAHFLGLELSLVYHGTVMVAMPDGYGLYRLHGLSAPEGSALTATPPPGTGTQLAASTLSAIQRLAAAAGHPLPAPRAERPAAAQAAESTTWIAYAGGVLIIALAWGASLRSQPPRLRRSTNTSG